MDFTTEELNKEFVRQMEHLDAIGTIIYFGKTPKEKLPHFYSTKSEIRPAPEFNIAFPVDVNPANIKASATYLVDNIMDSKEVKKLQEIGGDLCISHREWFVKEGYYWNVIAVGLINPKTIIESKTMRQNSIEVHPPESSLTSRNLVLTQI